MTNESNPPGEVRSGDQLGVAPKECPWVQEDDSSDTWDTGCGNRFVLNEGTPVDNGMRFCCYCGKALDSVPWTWDEEEDA